MSTALPATVATQLRRGVAIPAHPLALDADRRFSPRYQQALARYYIDAGAGGIAVGVHSTQFEIRDPDVGLFEPVLTLAAETIDAHADDSFIKIAGVCGDTTQAVAEAGFARDTGYHAALLSLAAVAKLPIPEIVAHCREVAQIMPVVGFYLQPAVGGRVLPYAFWREFAEIPGVVAIKMAPFNRYQTLDVVRAVCEADRLDDITLYTGNDDNIIVDLLSTYHVRTSAGDRHARIRGGLLGHWACWTRRAVEQLAAVHALPADAPIPAEMLTLAIEVTDANAAFFDTANAFAGCIPGIHEVLRRQGLLPGTWCLNPHEQLSPGQREEIDRVYASYPHLNDDAFVDENRDRWLAD
jgi:dihydrodipicolinate synthase/N-acetylneuraminate lyase